MFKISDSAFVEVVVNGGKPGPQSRNFSIDLLQVNFHERCSRGSICIWAAEDVLQLQEKQLALASFTRANAEPMPAGGAWGRRVSTSGIKATSLGNRRCDTRHCGR
jgi:hypothetical protein